MSDSTSSLNDIFIAFARRQAAWGVTHWLCSTQRPLTESYRTLQKGLADVKAQNVHPVQVATQWWSAWLDQSARAQVERWRILALATEESSLWFELWRDALLPAGPKEADASAAALFHDSRVEVIAPHLEPQPDPAECPLPIALRLQPAVSTSYS